jgi:hypothetical protein
LTDNFVELGTDHVLNIFKAFTFGIENDNQQRRDYRENVQRHIARLVMSFYPQMSSIMYDQDFILTEFELMLVYESIYSAHSTIIDNGIMTSVLYDRSSTLTSFLTITDLLEDAELQYGDDIMGNIHTPMNCHYIKVINLLEVALITKSDGLMKFLRIFGYEPIMAFYLYVKYNQAPYSDSANSLKCDDMLINLLMEDKSRDKFISLAKNGIVVGETYKRNKSVIIPPNLEVVEKIAYI